MIFDFLLQEDDKKKPDEKATDDTTATEEDPGADDTDTGDDLDMPDMGDDTEDPTTEEDPTTDDTTDDSTGDDMTDDTSEDPTADTADGTGEEGSLEDDSENVEDATEEASESLKKVKLARDYEKLYETMVTIIDKFNLLNKTSQEEADLINDTIKNLERLKVNLFDYIDLSYSNKSYEQNLYMYQYFKSSISVCAQIVQKIKDLRTKSVNK